MSASTSPEPLPHTPPPPPSSPETPLAIEAAIAPLLDRFAERIVTHVTDRALEALDSMARAREADTAKLMAAIDMIDQKGATRHKLLVNRLTKMEKKIRSLEQRVTALETTRIVLRSATIVRKRKKKPSRAPSRLRRR